MVVLSIMIADFGLRIADLISAAADGWTECSTGGSGDSRAGELRDSAGVAFSRVEVAVDAATEAASTTVDGATEVAVVTVFILFVFLFVPRAFVCFSEHSP